MTRNLSAILAALALVAGAWAQDGPRATGAGVEPGAYAEAFGDGDYQRARELIEAELRVTTKDPVLTYNLACAEAQLGLVDQAMETLLDAISHGMVDFHHLARDPHLEPLREHRTYRLILRGWRELLDARGTAELKAAREALGPTYTYETDESLRLHFASAAEASAHASAREEIERTAAWALEHVFPEDWDAGSDARPDPWVLVLIPTPEDFFRIVRATGIGGYFDKDRKRLISQDVGPSLRHEFFHVLHWRHMDRIGQVHPYWLMEGLASLLEDVEDAPAGGYELRPSWRTNIAKRLERAGALMRLDRLFALERSRFMGSKSKANYAQARAFCMFLHEQGVLSEWYRVYVEHFADEPTGATATEVVFGEALAKVEERYQAWLVELEEVAEVIRPADAALGVRLSAGRGDGPSVASLASPAAHFPGKERLRLRDVVTSIDGRTVRTLDDLQRILGEFEVGDRVVVGVRRGRREIDVLVELIPRSEAEEPARWP